MYLFQLQPSALNMASDKCAMQGRLQARHACRWRIQRCICALSEQTLVLSEFRFGWVVLSWAGLIGTLLVRPTRPVWGDSQPRAWTACKRTACDCSCMSLLRCVWGGPLLVLGTNRLLVVQLAVEWHVKCLCQQVTWTNGGPREPERRAAGQRPCSAWLSLQAFLNTGMLAAYRKPTRWSALVVCLHMQVIIHGRRANGRHAVADRRDGGHQGLQHF